jgi:hypothetical protein
MLQDLLAFLNARLVEEVQSPPHSQGANEVKRPDHGTYLASKKQRQHIAVLQHLTTHTTSNIQRIHTLASHPRPYFSSIFSLIMA